MNPSIPLNAMAAPEEKEARECDCPEWVIRCAHFGDLALTMGIKDLTRPCAVHLSTSVVERRYGVGLLQGPRQDCGHFQENQIVRIYADTDDLPGANWAFNRAEADLLASYVPDQDDSAYEDAMSRDDAAGERFERSRE